MKKNECIAVTGGMGSGKSSVSSLLAAQAGVPHLDLDVVCRDLLQINMPGWAALKASLGESYFFADGNLDRAMLRKALFADEQLRVQINNIVHPLALEKMLAESISLGGRVVIEVPLLFEAGWEKYFRSIVVVYADSSTCCRRVAERDSLSPGDAARAIASQLSIGKKALLADHVIDNRYCWPMTMLEVRHLSRLLREGLILD